MSKETVKVGQLFQAGEGKVTVEANEWVLEFSRSSISSPQTSVFNVRLLWNNPVGPNKNATGMVSVNKNRDMILSKLFGYNAGWKLYWTDTGFVVR